MAPALSSPLLRGPIGFSVFGGRPSPFPLLRFGMLRSFFDGRPSAPELFI